MQSAERPGLATGWAHDIRTHLSILLGALGMIKSGRLSQEQTRQYVSTMESNINGMMRLINRLLEDEMVGEAGEVRPEYVQIDSVLSNLFKSVRPLAGDKPLEFLSDIESPLYAYCDPEMLERVLYNLLSNAIKHTGPNGFVYLSAKSNDDWVHIHVADTGCGMTPQQQDAFHGGAPVAQGGGIGLQLVKSMTGAMGGRIRCASRPHVGTTFYLEIPAIMQKNTSTYPIDSEFIHNNEGYLSTR